MEKEDIEVNYDSEEDMLSISKAGARVKFSFDISLPNGDIVIDYDFKGLVVGVEFFNAMNYFPMLDKISDFSKLKANLNVQYGPNWAQIKYELYSPSFKQPISSLINAP